jgi:ribosomal protein L11 methyltransferase
LPVYLWRRTAKTTWVEAHQDLLQAHAHGHLVLVQRPGRKRLEVEIACASRRDSRALVKKFGGRTKTLRRNWLKQFARADSKPIKIGKRLIISNVEGALVSRHTGLSQIIIPASLAFGTGEHATTAMSLRFLEELTRGWKRGWSLVDVGTGTGILALAAKCFGAERVTGMDNDPAAISVARSNARLNKIRDVRFQLGDVHTWTSLQETDVITANLYSDLLIKILSKLGNCGWLILSGILHSQQHELVRALKRNHFSIINMKRRGKWVAILGTRSPVRKILRRS